jgi:hypothetical protein
MVLLNLAVAAFGLYRPRGVPLERPVVKDRLSPLLADLKRLLKHRPFLVATAISFAYMFSPIGQTVTLYLITDHLGGDMESLGRYYAIGLVATYPATMLFGFLQAKAPMKGILFWSVALTAVQFVPFLFIHSIASAYILNALAALMGGSLLRPSCISGTRAARPVWKVRR